MGHVSQNHGFMCFISSHRSKRTWPVIICGTLEKFWGKYWFMASKPGFQEPKVAQKG